MRKLLHTLTMALMLLALQQPAQAGMIGTEQALSPALAATNLDQARAAIERQLVELGVDAGMARERSQRLSDAQVAEIDQRLAEMPAGADAAGILLTVFVVFVITDVIGATDIFPFIHPVNSK